jgi:hypothetical protein
LLPEDVTEQLQPHGLNVSRLYEGVSKSIWTGRLERKLEMIQLSTASCSCIDILWVSLVSYTAITLCVASQRVFIVVDHFIIDSVQKLLVTPSYNLPKICKVHQLALLGHPYTDWKSLYIVCYEHIWAVVPVTGQPGTSHDSLPTASNHSSSLLPTGYRTLPLLCFLPVFMPTSHCHSLHSEAARSSETLVSCHITTWYQKREDHKLNLHNHESPKSRRLSHDFLLGEIKNKYGIMTQHSWSIHRNDTYYLVIKGNMAY